MSIPELLALPEEARIDWLRTHLWPANARMYAAVVAGIREVDPGARFSTHVSAVTVRPAMYVAFFEAMRDGGYRPDVLGFSFYPTIEADDSRDRWQGFKDTVTAAHQALDRPVFIAEYAYPAADTERFLWQNKPIAGYPLTPDGQARFLTEVLDWSRKAGFVTGIRPWAPDLVTEWGSMALFDRTGNSATARPAIDSLKTAGFHTCTTPRN